MSFTYDDRATEPSGPAPARPIAAPQREALPERTTATSPITPAPVVERCDSCDAPVDRAQRYCVVCGAHQRRADDPASRYLAEARRSRFAAEAPLVSASRPAGWISPPVAAVLIALLPVAAGIGVVVGRGGGNDGDQIVEALKAARNVGGAAAPAGSTPGAATTTDEASASTPADDEKSDGPKVDGIETSTKKAKILSNGPGGSARQLEGSKPTKQDIEESKKAVEQINARKGKAYIDTQRDLPDTIVVP